MLNVLMSEEERYIPTKVQVFFLMALVEMESLKSEMFSIGNNNVTFS